jgi:transposase-like protein
MLTDEQKSRAMALRTEVTTVEGRAAMVELKKEVQRGGATARELATVVGVHESTLCRWERQMKGARGRKPPTGEASSRSESRFRMVRVAPTPAPARTARPRPTGGGLRVAHAPSGLVIDGLDLETLTALLRRMS